MGFWKRLFPQAETPEYKLVRLTPIECKVLANLCYKQAVREKLKREQNSPMSRFYRNLQLKLQNVET